jgi:hypothetical protein
MKSLKLGDSPERKSREFNKTFSAYSFKDINTPIDKEHEDEVL